MKKIIALIISVVILTTCMSVSAFAAEYINMCIPHQTVKNRPDYVAFNTVVDNKMYGDERFFVTITEDKEGGATYSVADFEMPTLNINEDYIVAIFYCNDARSTSGADLRAKDTKVSVEFTRLGEELNILVGISSSNADPAKIMDGVAAWIPDGGECYVIPDSATLINKGKASGTALDHKELFSKSGALIGHDQIDGVIPNGFEYAGYVTFRIRIEPTSSQSAETPAPASVDPESNDARDNDPKDSDSNRPSYGRTAVLGASTDASPATGRTTTDVKQLCDALERHTRTLNIVMIIIAFAVLGLIVAVTVLAIGYIRLYNYVWYLYENGASGEVKTSVIDKKPGL